MVRRLDGGIRCVTRCWYAFASPGAVTDQEGRAGAASAQSAAVSASKHRRVTTRRADETVLPAAAVVARVATATPRTFVSIFFNQSEN